MQIYVFRDNQQTGPFSEAEVRAQLASGAITRESLVWWDGQADWKPLGQTPLGMAGGTALPLPPASPRPPAVAGGPMAGTVQTSGLAITSLVCGLIGLFCWIILGPVAVITGHIARAQIRKDPTKGGSGLALAGLILGYFWIVAGIIYLCVMGPMIMDQIKKARQQAVEIQNGAPTNPAPASPGQ